MYLTVGTTHENPKQFKQNSVLHQAIGGRERKRVTMRWRGEEDWSIEDWWGKSRMREETVENYRNYRERKRLYSREREMGEEAEWKKHSGCRLCCGSPIVLPPHLPSEQQFTHNTDLKTPANSQNQGPRQSQRIWARQQQQQQQHSPAMEMRSIGLPQAAPWMPEWFFHSASSPISLSLQSLSISLSLSLYSFFPHPWFTSPVLNWPILPSSLSHPFPFSPSNVTMAWWRTEFC